MYTVWTFCVFGRYASDGMASGLKGCMPQLRKPDCILVTVTASYHALLKIPQNVDLDTTAPGKEFMSSSQALQYAALKGPKTVRSHG